MLIFHVDSEDGSIDLGVDLDLALCSVSSVCSDGLGKYDFLHFVVCFIYMVVYKDPDWFLGVFEHSSLI